MVLLVGGAPRSGTGLARRVLGSHPEVTLPAFEMAFHRRREAGQAVPAAAAELVERLGDVDARELDVSSWGTLFRSLLAALGHVRRRSVPGDKTPGIEHHVELYRSWVPDRRMALVQMVRHPFDAVASHLHAPWFGGVGDDAGIAAIAAEWRRSAELAANGGAAEIHVVVRYEDLTTTPRSVASTLAAELGLRADDDAVTSMVEGCSYPRHVNSSFTTVGAHTEGTVHRGLPRHTHLTPRQRAVVAELCAPAAAGLGYPVVD